MDLFINWLIDWLINYHKMIIAFLLYRLVEWLIDLQIGLLLWKWLSDWLIDEVIDWFIDWLIDNLQYFVLILLPQEMILCQLCATRKLDRQMWKAWKDGSQKGTQKKKEDEWWEEIQRSWMYICFYVLDFYLVSVGWFFNANYPLFFPKNIFIIFFKKFYFIWYFMTYFHKIFSKIWEYVALTLSFSPFLHIRLTASKPTKSE